MRMLLADAGMAVEGLAPGRLGKRAPNLIGCLEQLLRAGNRPTCRQAIRPRARAATG